MNDLSAAAFVDLDGFEHRDLLSHDAPVWSALGD